MKLTDKRFLLWEIVLTLALSAMPLIMYGENISVIMLIVVSYGVVAAIGAISFSKIPVFATFILIFFYIDILCSKCRIYHRLNHY